MLVTGAVFYYIGNEIIARGKSTAKSNHERWRSFFGVTADTVADIWNALSRFRLLPTKGLYKHLMWTLCYLKVYDSETLMASLIKADEKTIRKWVWKNFLPAIAKLAPHIIRWEDRLPNNWHLATFRCWTSTDGTDVSVYETYPRDRHLKSHKFYGAALRYEIVVCIRTGFIVSVRGPYKAGAFPDMKILGLREIRNIT